MDKPSEGRILELEQSTKDQRKAISRVVTAIRAATSMDFNDIYLKAHGSFIGRSDEDERNLSKGKIAHKKIAPIYRWIIEHYLPIAIEISPEVFDPSLLTRWRDFIREHGIYDRLTFCFMSEINLTERSLSQPINDVPIKLGQKFIFSLDTKIDGQLLALEVSKSKTYPFSLHPNEVDLLIDVQNGKQFVPLNTNNELDPLSETIDAGLRCYVFLVAKSNIIESCIKELKHANSIKLDKLDQIALSFKGVENSEFELHRLNVIFSN